MKTINAKTITQAVKKLFLKVNFMLPADVTKKLKFAYAAESLSIPKKILKQILENARISNLENIPICQDTGVSFVFLEIGQGVCIKGGSLKDAVNKGVRLAYTGGYLRKSIVSDPLERKNTNDNTPCVIHTEITSGDKIKISVLAKGGGAENVSLIKNFLPAADISEIKKFVVDTVKQAGANACPPLVIGIGIGGTLDTVGLIAKKALFRNLFSFNKNKRYSELESELLDEINKTGLGPMALGGKTTALSVLIETAPCHITSLPVAVNLQCHALRRGSIIL